MWSSMKASGDKPGELLKIFLVLFILGALHLQNIIHGPLHLNQHAIKECNYSEKIVLGAAKAQSYDLGSSSLYI